jgi:hypothetical protein
MCIQRRSKCEDIEHIQTQHEGKAACTASHSTAVLSVAALLVLKWHSSMTASSEDIRQPCTN